MSGVSGSGAGVATASTGEAQPMAVSMGEQMKEPSSVWVATFPTGQMEEDVPEASLADVTMGQTSTSTSLTPSTAGGSAS